MPAKSSVKYAWAGSHKIPLPYYVSPSLSVDEIMRSYKNQKDFTLAHSEPLDPDCLDDMFRNFRNNQLATNVKDWMAYRCDAIRIMDSKDFIKFNVSAHIDVKGGEIRLQMFSGINDNRVRNCYHISPMQIWKMSLVERLEWIYNNSKFVPVFVRR